MMESKRSIFNVHSPFLQKMIGGKNLCVLSEEGKSFVAN
ncbi:hypothetical protein BLGI_799 [Brevibacillus laterosporus GI-9]|nr:hypothetical protein BLGI_799 [Brevibacillus laterosporus GI-9]